MLNRVLFIAAVLALSGCTSPEKLLCRAWKVDAVDFSPPKSDFEARIQKSVKDMVPSLAFTFRRDSTYTGGNKAEPTTGKWWFTDKKRSLVLTNAQEQTNSKIITLSKTKLVMNNTGPQGNAIKFTMSPLEAVSNKK